MNSKNWNSWEEREAAYRQERMECINREFAASKTSTEDDLQAMRIRDKRDFLERGGIRSL